jgi:AcrR family transcriptional regulator
MKVQEQSRRSYRQVRRAAAAAATGERILDAADAIFWERPTDQIPLDEVARRAGVSVQTVIRRFGGKQGLFDAAWQRTLHQIRQQRDEAVSGDVRGAVAVLMDHYEDWGDRALRLLAVEGRSPDVDKVLAAGRQYHAEACARIFGPTLSRLRGVERERRLAQLIAVTDVFTWRLLRRDRRLSRRQTELALIELLEPLTQENHT